MSKAEELRSQEEERVNQTLKNHFELFNKCFENKTYMFQILKGTYADQFITTYQQICKQDPTSDLTPSKQQLINKFDEIINPEVDEPTKWKIIQVIMDYRQNAFQLKSLDNNCELIEKQQNEPKMKTTMQEAFKKTTLTNEQHDQLKNIVAKLPDHSLQIQTFCEYLLKQNPKIDPEIREKTLAMLPKLYKNSQVKQYRNYLNKQYKKINGTGCNFGNKSITMTTIRTEIDKLEKQLETMTPNPNHPNLKHYQLFMKFKELYSCALHLQTTHKNKKLPAVQYKYFLEADILFKFYETKNLPRSHRYWEAFSTVLDGTTALVEYEKQTKIRKQKEWNKFCNHLLSNANTTYKEKIINYVEHYFDQFNQEFETPFEVYKRINNTKIQNIKRILHTSKQPTYQETETMEAIQQRCDKVQRSDQTPDYKEAINLATLNHLKAYPIAKCLASDRKSKLVKRKDVSEAEALFSFYEEFDKITNPKKQLQTLKKLIRFASNASKISGNPKKFGDRHTLKQHVKYPINIHK